MSTWYLHTTVITTFQYVVEADSLDEAWEKWAEDNPEPIDESDVVGESWATEFEEDENVILP